MRPKTRTYKTSDVRAMILHAYEGSASRATDARNNPLMPLPETARAEGQATAFLAVLDLLDGHTAMISRFTGTEVEG